MDDNFNVRRLRKENNSISAICRKKIQNNQSNFDEKNKNGINKYFQSDTFKHLHFHKKYPSKMIQRSQSLLAPIFHKSSSEVINDWYKNEGGEITSSHREKYYKKQKEAFIKRAKNIKFEEEQTNVSILPPKPPKLPLKHSTYNFMEDDPLAKYNLRDLMIEKNPKSCESKKREQNFIGHDNNCVDCNRFQIKIKHLEGQLEDYKKLQKDSLQFKVELKRNPISKLK